MPPAVSALADRLADLGWATGLLVAGSIGLIGLFCVGFLLPGNKLDERPVLRDVPAEPMYRKTA